MRPTPGVARLLWLADGRLPAGGHAHSGGVEAAVVAGLVRDVPTLSRYLAGRLATTGRVDAAFAVAAWRWAARPDPEGAAALDTEAASRTASPAVRAATRAQGRGLLRVLRRSRSVLALDVLATVNPDGPLAPIVLGAAVYGQAAVSGQGTVSSHAGRNAAVDGQGGHEPFWAATIALWSTINAPAWAAVRLLGLDPIEVAGLLDGLGAALDTEATNAARWADRPEPVSTWLAQLPASGAPLTEIGAESGASWEVRLFAS